MADLVQYEPSRGKPLQYRVLRLAGTGRKKRGQTSLVTHVGHLYVGWYSLSLGHCESGE